MQRADKQETTCYTSIALALHSSCMLYILFENLSLPLNWHCILLHCIWNFVNSSLFNFTLDYDFIHLIQKPSVHTFSVHICTIVLKLPYSGLKTKVFWYNNIQIQTIQQIRFLTNFNLLLKYNIAKAWGDCVAVQSVLKSIQLSKSFCVHGI